MAKKLKVYYAHPLTLYGTKQEERDVKMLEQMGFEVINPGSPEFQQQTIDAKAEAAKGIRAFAPPGFFSDVVMEFCRAQVDQCDGVAFRAFVDGTIPAGVHSEILQASRRVVPGPGFVIELPRQIEFRGLSVDQTRAVLAEMGQR